MSLHLRLIALALFFAGGTGMLPGQSISTFVPPFGAPSDPQFIYIYGTGFYPGTLRVWFNGTLDPTAAATSVNGTVIAAKVPAGASTGPICVSVNFGQPACSSGDFIVIGPGPYISDISPTTGSANSQVTLIGSHFLTGITSVQFNGQPASWTPPTSDSTMDVFAPSGVTTGPITVSGPKGSSTSSQTFYATPLVTGFTPATGRTATNILVTGNNFLGATAVRFAGTNGAFTIYVTPTVLSNTALIVTAPVGVTNGQLRLVTQAGSFTTTSNFVVAPTLFGFSPGAGSVGTNVVLTGANFNVGTPVVRFNGTASTSVTGVFFGQLTATVPAGATTGPISVTTTNGSHTNAAFFYLPPVITSFTPTNSAPGTTVTLTGQNLLGVTNVNFNGTQASFTPPVNNTTLQAIVPNNLTTGPISVTTPAGTATSARLFYAAPVITGFAPASGLPGTNVTITGSNFLGASAVRFNGLNASFVPPVSNTSIQATVPAGAQTGPISVIAPAGSSTSSIPFVLNYSSDVTLNSSASPNPVFLGSNLVYSLVISNKGPHAAPNVTLTDLLPSSVSLLSAAAPPGTLTTNGNPILGSFGSVAVGGSVTVILTVAPTSTGTITNVATVASDYPDPAPSNNTTNLTTTVLPLPVLSVGLLSGNRLRLSWPLPLSNYVLEYKPTLAGAGLWSGDTNPPAISGAENVVIETNTAVARFYRLRN